VTYLFGRASCYSSTNIYLLPVRSFFDEGLIDEVTVAIHPLFLGARTPLVPIGTRKTTLRLVEEK
jgi:hypothetical protein